MKLYLPLLFTALLISCRADTPPATDATIPADITPDTLTYTHFSFSDSAALVAGHPHTPFAIYDVRTIVPAADDERLNILINSALARLIAGDAAPIKTKDLRQALKVAAREVLYDYRQQDVAPALLQDLGGSYMLTHDYHTTPLLNAKGLLSLATTHYFYAGGAHGMYYTVMHNFATDSLLQLTYEDVFLPDQESELRRLLTAHADHSPSGVDTIPVTENFGFTPEGLLFDYPPYEIGSYAEGEITILLPYEEVSHLMTGLAETLVLNIR